MLSCSMMAMIAIAVIFDDDKEGPRSTPGDDNSLFDPDGTEDGMVTQFVGDRWPRTKKP